MKGVKKVVVAVDGSQSSISAVRAAARLADALEATLTLLYVYPLTPVQLSGVMQIEQEDFERMRDLAAQDAIGKVSSGLGDQDMEVETVTLVGDPATEILQYLDDRQDVLAVMGRRSQSKIQSLLLGSVSDKVVRHTRTPVTIVT